MSCELKNILWSGKNLRDKELVHTEEELKRYRKRLNPCRYCGSLGVDLYSFQTLRMDTYVGVKCIGCGTKIPPVMVLDEGKLEWDSAVDIAIRRWKGVS